jgi:hypothetical protein
MDIGMLWFDNDKQADFRAKVERAVMYYRDKYGKAPNLCFVHPTMLPNNDSEQSDKPSMKSQGVEIRTSNTMLPHHFWIGINRQESTPAL